MTGATEDSATR